MARAVTEDEVTLDPAPEHEAATIRGRSPWSLAWGRLRRNYVALAFLAVFILIVLACALAPLYADHVAHTDYQTNHILDVVDVSGRPTPVVSKGGIIDGKLVASTPIAPTWWHADGKFVLGADSNGRDVAVRLLYGGRTSLIVGIVSSLICLFLAVTLSLIAGYFGGWLDFIISRFYDLFYAFPVVLLGIALGAALAVNGFHHFGITIESGSIWIPLLVISYVQIPYVGRPLRGQILSLREKEFVEAAVAHGASPFRIMFSELLPNVLSTVLVFFPLVVATNIMLEAALSYLGAGVQPPTPSWGTLIADGQQLIVTRPWLALAPGLAIVFTVLSLNVFGDGLRDALDPRSKVGLEH